MHTGKQIMMTLRPALPDSGICFRRVDLPEPIDIVARAANVGETTLGTTLDTGAGAAADKGVTAEADGANITFGLSATNGPYFAE